MKLRLTIESGRRMPGRERSDNGQFLAWAELGGEVVGDVLARHANREVAEHLAQQELARRLGALLTSPATRRLDATG